MADRYWVKNEGVGNANDASSWNTAADGSGSTGIPATSDTVHIGHITTLAANKGVAPINWDLNISLNTLTTYSGYKEHIIESDEIQFISNNTISHATTNWDDLGLSVGMEITTTGATNGANNASFVIATISNNVMTLSTTAIVNEAAGADITITTDRYLNMASNLALNKLILDSKMTKSAAGSIIITFSGSYPVNESYVFNGNNATIENQEKITYSFDTTGNGTTGMRFAAGPYPIVSSSGNSYFSPQYYEYSEDTIFDGLVEMYTLKINSGAQMVFVPSVSPTLNANRTFSILNTSGVVISGTTFDAGFSTFAFTMDADNWVIPVTGDTTYGTAPFICRFYNLIIKTPSTAGFRALVPDNRTLSVNSITVEADAILKGQMTAGAGSTSTICSVRRPVIKGSWNFSQLSDGIYVSLMPDTFPITPSDGPVGRVQLSNAGGTFTSDADLTFSSDTLHTDKGIKIIEHSTKPIAAGATGGVLYVKNTNPSTLVFVSNTEAETTLGAGGGGGITALTGDVTASGSGSVAATIAAGAVEHAMLDADCVDGDNIADDSINSEHYVDGSIDTAHIADDQVTAAKLANSINSEITANTAKVTNATHSGEVTGATALTIADDVVDEANLKVSNSPTNGYALTAQSAASGGLTWAAMSGGTALEFAEWRLENHDPSTSGATGGSFKCLDLADTSFWAQATTSSDHTSIVLHSDGYVTLAANGIYDVWFSADLFGVSTSAGTDDCWLSISTNNSNDRRYATQRDAKYINGTQVKWNTQLNAKIKTGGSTVDIYFGGYINGSNFYFGAYNDYRTSVKIIRLGDA